MIVTHWIWWSHPLANLPDAIQHSLPLFEAESYFASVQQLTRPKYHEKNKFRLYFSYKACSPLKFRGLPLAEEDNGHLLTSTHLSCSLPDSPVLLIVRLSWSHHHGRVAPGQVCESQLDVLLKPVIAHLETSSVQSSVILYHYDIVVSLNYIE